MMNRRVLVLALTAGFVALGMIVTPVIADELLGIVTRVDVEHRKLTVLEKESDKEVEFSTTDETEFVTPKSTGKLVLKKLAKGVERAKEKGRKGIPVNVTHEKSVASKITLATKKKAAPKAND